MKHLSVRMAIGMVLLILLASSPYAFSEERAGLGSLNTSLAGLPVSEQTTAKGIEWTIQTDQMPEPEAKKSWTFMVYMCASNNLGVGARSDLEEMALSGFDESMANVVVYTGGSTEWGGANIPLDKNTLLSIHDKEIRRVMEFDPIVNMSIYDTLCKFIDTATTQYPAEKYALILWDHGAGPILGVINDAVFKTGSLELVSLQSALESSPFKDQPLEFLGFDACLMGNVEVAKTIQPYAKYMVASEESEPGTGWNYAFLGEIEAATPTNAITENIVDRYIEYYTQNPQRANGLKVTIASIDLGQIDGLKASCAEFFKEAADALSDDNYIDFAKARDKSLKFSKDLDLVDLGALLKNLDGLHLPGHQKVVDSLDKAVHYSRSVAQDATGMTVYYPYDKGIMYSNKYKKKYVGLSLAEEYTHFIDEFVSYLINQPYVEWSGVSSLGSLKGNDAQDEPMRDFNTGFTLQLTDEQYEFLAESRLLVFESVDEGAGYALVSIIPDVVTDDENHTVSAAYVHRALFVTTEDGSQILSGALPYDLIGDDYYSLEATLVGHDAQGNEIRQPARLEFTLQAKDGTLELAQILIPEEDDFYTTRHNLTLSDFDSLEIVREIRMPVPQAEGDDTLQLAFDQWETVRQETCVVPLDGSCSLRMLHDQLNHDDIYVGFALRDYQNRHYIRDLQKLIPNPAPDSVTVGGIDDDYLQLSMPWPSVDAQGAKLTFRVCNTSSVEDALFRIANVRLNGQPCQMSLDIYGNGTYEGLTIGEEQFGTLPVPAELLSGMGTLTRVDFDVQLLDAANGDSLVHTLEDCWVILSLDVSAF